MAEGVVEPARLAPERRQPHIAPIVSLVAGSVAGGVEAASTYPFEFAKTRLQLRDGTGGTKNPVVMIRQVVATEGLGGLYTGCSTLILGTVFKATVRVLSFDAIRNSMSDEKGRLTPVNGMLAGTVAGCVESVVAVTPTERIKTALIDDAKGPKRMASFATGTRLIVREQGFAGLYRGLVPTTMKQSANSAVRMGSYNVLKEAFQDKNIPINGATTFGMGAMAGIITVYATQPFDTVKTRVQSVRGESMKEALGGILRERGIKGLWNGSTMRLGRLIFSGGIVFSVYEHVAALLGNSKLGM